ncbi:MAG: hypothetical protein IJ171_01355 [Ruminococcus sp.]|nr:hypothetical protein [Ruminococcus sp.]
MKRFFAVLLCLLLVCTAFTAYADTVKIKYPHYQVGTHTHARLEQTLIEMFQQEFGDQYELVIEDLPSDTEYTNKMKTLAATKELPDLIDGKNGLRDLAIKNGQCVDL